MVARQANETEGKRTTNIDDTGEYPEQTIPGRKAIMSRDRLTTGNEVPCGVYRCNACAKQIDLQEDKTKLPQCNACGGFSWRTKRACKISESTE